MISTRTARTLSIAAFAAAFAGVAAAQAQETDKDKATIIVAGEGRATTAPDMAVLQLSVVKDGKTAREALDANNKTMAEVLKALKDGGIADRDLQTSGFMLNPQYTYPTNTDGSSRAPELIGYQVTNGVSVRVRDLAKLGEVIDKSVSLGVNQGGGVQFTNDKPEAVITEARKAAVADAVEELDDVLDDGGDRAGVAKDPGDLVGRRRLVHRHEGDPDVGGTPGQQGPLVPGAAHEAHAVAVLEAHRDEPAGDRSDPLTQLAGRHLLPLLGRGGGVPARGQEHDDGLGDLRDPVDRARRRPRERVPLRSAVELGDDRRGAHDRAAVTRWNRAPWRSSSSTVRCRTASGRPTFAASCA